LQLLSILPPLVRRFGDGLLWKRDYFVCVARK